MDAMEFVFPTLPRLLGYKSTCKAGVTSRSVRELICLGDVPDPKILTVTRKPGSFQSQIYTQNLRTLRWGKARTQSLEWMAHGDECFYAACARNVVGHEVFGGHIQKFDFKTKTWTQLPAIPTWRRDTMRALVAGNFLYVIGGLNQELTVEKLNLKTLEWSPEPDIDERLHFGVAAFAESVYILGGYIRRRRDAVDPLLEDQEADIVPVQSVEVRIAHDGLKRVLPTVLTSPLFFCSATPVTTGIVVIGTSAESLLSSCVVAHFDVASHIWIVLHTHVCLHSLPGAIVEFEDSIYMYECNQKLQLNTGTISLLPSAPGGIPPNHILQGAVFTSTDPS